jgi:ferredoxin--NADP+ reductase
VKPRVAVVGSGPSGMYAADALLDNGMDVDVIDQLPVPFGLVRYGVAPDHTSIRSVRDTLDQIWDKPGIRFFGNVKVGDDVSIEELLAAYHAVFLTYGASSDRRLGIEGEELPGSVAATDFVAWYTGHPDYRGPDFDSLLPSVRSVAVVGVGNVAVDVVRVLSKSADELAGTDMPDHVLAALDAAPIESVFLLGRRGPVQASFTTKELRELGELQEADIRVAAVDLELDPSSEAELASNKVAARNHSVMLDWLARSPRGSGEGVKRIIDIKFFRRPVRILGADRVAGIELERTEFDHTGSLRGTGEVEQLAVDLVVRSVGYRGTPLPGVPFDPDGNVIPNVEGRVVNGSTVVPGLYVAGWIKRGPTGIIGTNKKCAVATVASLLEDIEEGRLTIDREAPGIDALLAARGVRIVDSAGWRSIDAQERERGEAQGRPRLTIHERAELLDIGAGVSPRAST